MNHLYCPFRQLAAGAAILGILSITPTLHEARAQSGRTVRAIVPTPPAGVNDLMARLMGDYLGKTHGLSMVIENRAGAAELIGTEAVARAAPDGNTLLFGSTQVVINPLLRKVNYHPLESFEPVCLMVVAPLVFSVQASSPYRTLNDLLDAARAKPGSVTMGSLGPGTPFDIGLAMLKNATKVDITFVPFNGNGPSINALLGGHVTSTFNSYSSISGQLKGGLARPLAVASKTRIPPLPDVPTVIEFRRQGLRGRALVRRLRAREDAEGDRDAVRRLALGGAEGAGGQGKAGGSGALSHRRLRGGIRCVPAQAKRGVRPRHQGGELQAGIGQAGSATARGFPPRANENQGGGGGMPRP